MVPEKVPCEQNLLKVSTIKDIQLEILCDPSRSNVAYLS